MKQLRVLSKCDECDRHREPIGDVTKQQTASIMVLFYEPQDDTLLGGSYERYFAAQLRECGLNTNVIYFEYVVSCHGSDSKVAEEACQRGLIDAVSKFYHANGRVILAVGEEVVKALQLGDSLKKLRGSVCYSDVLQVRVPIIPTFSAEYLIRGNTAELITAYADIDKARDISENGYQAPHEDFYLGDNIDFIEKEIVQVIKKAVQEEVIIGVDLETTSLDPRKAKIITVGIALDEHKAISVPFMHDKGQGYGVEYNKRARSLLQTLFNQTVQLYHNANFDVSVLLSLGFDLPNTPHDTMLMHHVLHPELPHDLGYVTSIYGRTPYWKGAVLNNKSTMMDMPDEELRRYNLRDCVVMMQIYPKLKQELEADNLWFVYDHISRRLIRPTVLMKVNGMRLIPNRLKEWKKEVAEAVIEAKNQFIGVTKAPASFNPNSAYHTGWLFFGKKPGNYAKAKVALAEYEVPGCKKKKDTKVYQGLLEATEAIDQVVPLKLPKGSASRTQAGNLDLSGKSLTRIIMLTRQRLDEINRLKRPRPDHVEEKESLLVALKGLQAFLDYKKWAKLQSTYTDFTLGSDGRIHPGYKIHGTRTGRLASSGPNWQNLPKAVKMLFGPEENNVIVAADFSNIEMRVLAYESNDDVLQETFDSGRKVHDENVKIMFGLEKDHPMFDIAKRAAKTYIFGRGYGGGLKGIYERIIVQVPELKLSFDDFVRLDENYRNAHPAYVEWVNKMQEQAKERWVENAFGRKRYFLDPPDMVKREILNTPIQSTAADIFNLALIEMQEWIDTNQGLHARLIGAVHDSIVVECPHEYAKKVANKLVEVMETGRMLWGKMVSFPVEAEICEQSWAEPIALADYKEGVSNGAGKGTRNKQQDARNWRDEWQFTDTDDNEET